MGLGVEYMVKTGYKHAWSTGQMCTKYVCKISSQNESIRLHGAVNRRRLSDQDVDTNSNGTARESISEVKTKAWISQEQEADGQSERQ